MAGWSYDNTQLPQAVIWDNNNIINLGVPADYSAAYDINDSNVIVGNLRTPLETPQEVRKTFVIENGNITYLPILDHGSWDGSINNEGVIVYSSLSIGNSRMRGVRYYNNQAEDLNNLIPQNSGINIISALRINNKGEILCGADKDGARIYCILKPIDMLITSPRTNEKWIAGEEDTIRWEGGKENEFIKLLYSTDEGDNFELIDAGIPADDTMYVWDVPDTLLGRKSVIRIEKNDNSDILAESELFRIKPYIITKVDANGDYVVYDIETDRWGFGNTKSEMWPSSWWYGRFDYNNGIDPFTNSTYSQWQGDSVFYNAFQYDHFDWISFVNAFGVDACYTNTFLNNYSNTALQIWKTQKGEWGGSCFGIAIANALAFQRRTDFLIKYNDFPFFSNPIDVVSGPEVIPVITELFTHQFGNPHFAHLQGNALNTSPASTIRNIKEMLKEDSVKIRTLSFRKNSSDPNDQGGHAIVAYKLMQDETNDNIYYVYVWDNSYQNLTDARIEVDVEHNGSIGLGLWDPEYGWNGWGGDKWFYLRDPAESYLTNPTIPKLSSVQSPFILADNILRIQNPYESNILLSNNLGQSIGVRNDSLVNTITNAFPHIIENGSVGRPLAYVLPSDSYSIKMNNFIDSSRNVEAHVYTGNKTFVYKRFNATQTQTDRLFFDDGVSISNPDNETKSVRLMNIINETTQEKVFILRELDMAQNDSLKIMNPDDNKLDIISNGSSKSYDVELNFGSKSGMLLFKHSDVPLNQNSTHKLIPNWGDFVALHLEILVDNGNDGTIDDTLHLKDQGTGIEEHGSNTLPTEFNLEQNYPNPFNNSTIIRYSITEKSHVTLKVFDVLGKEIAILVNKEQSQGNHEIDFDASTLTSGVYFYRIQTGDFVDTKKMILMK